MHSQLYQETGFVLILMVKAFPKQVLKLPDVIVNTLKWVLDNNLDMVQVLCGR